jgi:hypothetical protein
VLGARPGVEAEVMDKSIARQEASSRAAFSDILGWAPGLRQVVKTLFAVR